MHVLFLGHYAIRNTYICLVLVVTDAEYVEHFVLLYKDRMKTYILCLYRL